MCFVAETKLLLITILYISTLSTVCSSTESLVQPPEVRQTDAKNVKPFRSEAEALLNSDPSIYETFSAHHSQEASSNTSTKQEDKNETRTYESTIVENLVNHILAKVRQSDEVESGNEQALEALESQNSNQHHGTPVERSSGELLSPDEAAISAAQVFGTGGSILAPSNQPEMDELASQTIEQQQQQELDDRHIQYDIVRQQHQPIQRLVELSQQQQLYTNLEPDTGGRHSADYKLSRIDHINLVKNNVTDDTNNNFSNRESNGSLKTPDASQIILEKSMNSTSNESPVTLNSTNVVDVVAPSPLMNNLDQPLTNITGRSLGSVQARSMHSNAAAKAPQHTRPPYATHDQFSSHKTTNDSTTGSVAQNQHKSNSSSAHHDPDKMNDDKLQKLTNSQLVELSPLPVSVGATNRISSGITDQAASGDRLHFSKENSIFGSSSPNRAHNDRYSAEHYEQPTNIFNDLPSGNFYLNSGKPSSEHQLVERDNKNDSHDSRRSVHEPTKGTSTYAPNLEQNHSNQQRYQQLEAAESQQIGSSIHHDPRDHQTSGALLVLHRTAPPTHYAASLVNVTAPMVLPLSASEAMESALGGGQAAKTLLNQVSGLLRPAPQGLLDPAAPSSGRNQLNSTNMSGRQPSHQQQATNLPPQYYMPGFSGVESQSIYSPPANQFSPKPIVNHILSDLQSDSSNSSTSNTDKERMRLDGSGYILAASNRRPTAYQQLHSAMNVSQPQHQASGFRSPQLPHLSSSSSASSNGGSSTNLWPSTSLPLPSSYLGGSLSPTTAGQQQAPPGGASSLTTVAQNQQQQNSSLLLQQQQQQQQQTVRPPQQNLANAANSSASITTSTTNGFITGATSSSSSSSSSAGGGSSGGSSTGPNGSGGLIPPDPSATTGLNRRVFNLTRVEHISAECSNDLIRTVIVFNGTFKGIIYSSGYVRDPSCLYINGTGKTRYDFSIRLNQCGTLGRQELHPPARPNEVSRRDQVMWNTLSIQYNPVIEQEWDEHFRVSCEYGSDFWKTVSFSPFNVETNTGAPVVFTVDPPQCQMEILRGHGMVGPRQEAVSGPVTVGDPLTLLIHMKSEKAGYDILVKNCIAHNGGREKMQLIDSNGCVVNERFISPFRGSYNDNDLKHVTLYSYLKAFRFTGSPVLYLECEIHMCQSSCPPQMCYWRRISKRSANESSLIGDNSTDVDETMTTTSLYQQEVTTTAAPTSGSRRKGRQMMMTNDSKSTTSGGGGGQISDKVSLFQALEVRQERPPDAAPYSLTDGGGLTDGGQNSADALNSEWPLMCYRRAEVLAFLFTAVSLLLVALSVTAGCCWRAASLRLQNKLAVAAAASVNSANSSPLSPPLSFSSSSNSSCFSSTNLSPSNNSHLNEASYFHNSTQYRKSLGSVGPMMVQETQHHSKQRHKECLISPNYL